MRIGWISLTDFRSYEQLDWEPDSGVNLLIGLNGSGKTNLLEAVAYLGSLRSFRGTPEEALISVGAERAVVRASVRSGSERLVELEINRKGPRRVQVDKSRLGRISDLLGVVRTISFLPEDLDLVKRGPALRRDLLDEIGVQLWPGSYQEQSDYERALRQRNAFLKGHDRDTTTLGVWDSRMAAAGSRVIARRFRALSTIAESLDACYREVSGIDVGLGFEYRASWSEQVDLTAPAARFADELALALDRARGNDMERRMTTVGPHRDEPLLILGGLDARTHASQGEQRTVALSVRLAAHRAVEDQIGEAPLLLLDDVFSELDEKRAMALAAALPMSSQTFITSARPEDVPVTGRQWSVTPGRVS